MRVSKEAHDATTREAVAMTTFAIRVETGRIVGLAARGEIPSLAGVDIMELVVGSAWQLGFEEGLRVALMDRLGGEAILDSFEAFVHDGEEDSIRDAASDSRKLLEGFLR